MHVDRVRITGQVDEAPDLRLAEHGEEIGPVLEPGGDRAPAADLLLLTGACFDDGDHRFIGRDVFGELPHRQHGGAPFLTALLLHQRDGAHRAALQLLRVLPPEVGGEHRRWPRATATSLDDAKAKHLRIR